MRTLTRSCLGGRVERACFRDLELDLLLVPVRGLDRERDQERGRERGRERERERGRERDRDR